MHVSSLSVLGPKHHFDTDESSPYVYGDVYTDTKIDSELVALEFAAAGSIEVVVIRPGFVYGSGDNHCSCRWSTRCAVGGSRSSATAARR